MSTPATANMSDPMPAAGTSASGFAAAPIPTVPVGPSEIDPQAVERARREIQHLVRELAEFAKSDIAPAAFYEAMLTRIVSALAAEGGAVWVVGPSGALEPVYQVNFRQARLDDTPRGRLQHARLLQSVMAEGEPLLVPPHSGSGEDGSAGNPTKFLLILSALKNEQGAEGVIEILQRGGTRQGSQRGYLRFVQQMCELAADYLKARRLRQFADQQTLWHQVESFAHRVHQSLDVRGTAFTVANEGRRLVGCDRASVAIGRRGRCVIEAISGQDTFDKRSNVVTRLAALASAVTATGEALWYTGDTRNLAPQVEKALEAYVDLSHSKTIAVLPLARPPADDKSQARPDIVGALIVEQIQAADPTSAWSERVELVARHSAPALANAAEHHSVFLLPLWRALARMKPVSDARRLPRWWAIGIVAALGLASLAFVPADFQLEARGVLQPALRREVFAGIDGVVMDVPAEHGKMVDQGEVLAELRNTDLEVEMADLVGRREATDRQMRSIERALLGKNQLSLEEQNRLSGQLLQLRETHESLGRQLELYRQKRAALQVTSPIAGQVVTWQARERLIRRPVRQGQKLMSIADPQGDWELEIHVPEDRMGHVARAAAQRDQPLAVHYMVATHPGTSFVGRVRQIHTSAQLQGDEGNVVLMRVDIDKNQLEDLRPGASVTARIDCGRRSLAYVWLHDLFAFVQSRILFRL